MDTFEEDPVDRKAESREGRMEDRTVRRADILAEVLRMNAVLESERDLLVSGEWERLDVLLEDKIRLSGTLAGFLSGLSPETLDEPEADPSPDGDNGAPSLRGAILHMEELASVNLVLARESSLIVKRVLNEINLESQGGQTYGSSGTVGPGGQQSPALVSTRG